ncbi:MAG TPA: hypothetical protein D7H85_01180 [Candidatus Poseidoniales archaeon]|nr:MAG TPA: hypothetical protein D7H85_01180 [Candidatus Poseidoniales archaeon]
MSSCKQNIVVRTEDVNYCLMTHHSSPPSSTTASASAASCLIWSTSVSVHSRVSGIASGSSSTSPPTVCLRRSIS